MVLVLSNSEAGTVTAAALDAAATVLRAEAGGSVEVVKCEGPADMGAAIDRHGSGPVVVAGGDGTLHAAVNVLYQRGQADACDVGLIPLGTGNDFARGLGIPLDPRAAARALLHGRSRVMDLLADDSGSVAVNAVHVGVGAQASRTANQWKRWLGPAAFLAGSVAAGFSVQGWRLETEIDGEVLTDGDADVLMVGMANASPSIGGGSAALVPHAVPDDGYVDVMVSRATGPVERVAYATRLRHGTQGHQPGVTVTRARTVTVRGHSFPTNADGENGNATGTRTWTVERRAWRALLPAPQ